jgi:hypothetical protein
MPICYVRIIWFDIIVDYIVILSVFFFFSDKFLLLPL